MSEAAAPAAVLNRFRVITDEPACGTWNMAVDQALLESVETGQSGPVLRFYGWHPPCLSLGYFQPDEVVDWNACNQRGIDVVRRPTGGRAILHDRELTYSVSLPLKLLASFSSVLDSYLRISRALLVGLRRLEVDASLAPQAPTLRSHGPACFDRPSSYEVLLDGRKLVGSAQVRRRNALLQHGSILFQPQVEELLACLSLSERQRNEWRMEMVDSVAGLAQIRPDISVADLASALTAGFVKEFGWPSMSSRLTQAEHEFATRLSRELATGAPGPSVTAAQNTTRTR
jgi:lipoate-protein ligase A